MPKKLDVYMGNCACGRTLMQRADKMKHKLLVCKHCKGIVTKLIPAQIPIKK